VVEKGARDTLNMMDSQAIRRFAKKACRYVRHAKTQLRLNPILLGEIYREKGNIQEYNAVLSLIAVNYATDVLRKLVVVRSVTPTAPFYA